MKRFILALTALLTMTASTQAMSYEQAREQALFLTDKMAYELNLTDAQYEAAYEINLDYLMGVNTYDEVYGDYWRYRNLDMSYILYDWQYQAYLNSLYFYRPLYWDAGFWHFRIYTYYPHRDFFYFGRPAFYASYRGIHSWGHNGGMSWYRNRGFGAPAPGRDHFGMRDSYTRGDFGQGVRGLNSRNAGQLSQRGRAAFGNGGRATPNGQRAQQPTSTRGNSFGGNRSNGTFSGNSTRQGVGSGTRGGNVNGQSGFGARRSSTQGGQRATGTTRNMQQRNLNGGSTRSGSVGTGSSRSARPSTFSGGNTRSTRSNSFSSGATRSGSTRSSMGSPSRSSHSVGTSGSGVTRSSNFGSSSHGSSHSGSLGGGSHGGGFGGGRR